MSSSQVIVRNKSVLRSIAGTTGKPTSARTLIALSLLITALCALFTYDLNYDLIFSKRGWFNFFWYWFERFEFDAALLLGAILAALYFSPKVEQVEGIAAWMTRKPWLTAIGVTALLSVCTLVVYKNHPLCMDEYADWFQSRVFAAGSLAGQWPPELVDWLLPKGFQGAFLKVSTSTGAVMSGYFPGYALVQVPFVFLGIPWLCNPALVGATLLVLAYIARTIFGDLPSAGWVLLFAIASPVFLINGISYYSSSGQLLLNLGFCALLLKPSPRRLLLAGVVGGLSAFYHHPIRHVFFALPWVVWIGWTYRPRLKGLFLLAAGYLPSLLMLGGAWLYFRTQITTNTAIAAAAGTAIQSAAGISTAIVGLLQNAWELLSWPSAYGTYARLAGLVKTWLWTVPMIPLLAVFAVARCRDARVQLMFWSAVSVFLGYLFLMPDDQGHGWGDRYFHAAWGVLPILAYAWIAEIHKETPDQAKMLLKRIGVGAIAYFLMAFPLRLWQVHKHMQEHLAQLPQSSKGVPGKIVLLNGYGYYAVDLVQNDPWMRGTRHVLYSQGTEKDAVMMRKYFPTCRLIDYPPYGSACAIE
jgi:hypothetical protein